MRFKEFRILGAQFRINFFDFLFLGNGVAVARLDACVRYSHLARETNLFVQMTAVGDQSLAVYINIAQGTT